MLKRSSVRCLLLSAFLLLAQTAAGTATADDCDCFLFRCDAQGNVLESIDSSTPAYVLANESDLVRPDLITWRDYDIRVTLRVSQPDAQRLIDAIGNDLVLDTNGDGVVRLQLNFSHLQREGYNAGTCEGKQSDIHKLAFAVLSGDDREVGGLPNPVGIDPFQAVLPGGWVDTPLTTQELVYYQPSAKIDFVMKGRDRASGPSVLYRSRVRSADRRTRAALTFRYDGPLPFQNNSGDLKQLNVPLHLSTGAILYCSNYREVALLSAADPNLAATMEVGPQGLCFAGLEDKGGEDICVHPLPAQAGDTAAIEDSALDDMRESIPESTMAVIDDVRIYRYAGLECEIYDPTELLPSSVKQAGRAAPEGFLLEP